MAAILENQQSAITPELFVGSSTNFYHRYQVFDLTYFLKVTEVKSSKQQQYWHVSLLFDLEHSNIG
jgi:hypothetical protein